MVVVVVVVAAAVVVVVLVVVVVVVVVLVVVAAVAVPVAVAVVVVVTMMLINGGSAGHEIKKTTAPSIRLPAPFDWPRNFSASQLFWPNLLCLLTATHQDTMGPMKAMKAVWHACPVVPTSCFCMLSGGTPQRSYRRMLLRV